MALAKFALDLEHDGTGSILVNGEDVSKHVAAGQVSFAVHEIPRLTLRLVGDGRIEGEGVVEVERNPDTGATQPLGEIVADWIAELDPMQIWALALDGHALSDHPAPTILAYLASLAKQELR